MTEQKLLFIDIEPKSSSSAPVDNTAEKSLWSRTDNSFRFNFITTDSPALHGEPSSSSSSSDRAEATASQISFTGQGSGFAFNFQIPPGAPVENMDTTETPDAASSSGSQQGIQKEKPSLPEEVNSPTETTAQAKAKKKKKKKPGKKTPSDSTEPQQSQGSAEGSQGGEDAELSAEEQLNRQLDWCIEQLELGMRSQKGTPKQKEEASRALKTLRSSKAPLAKKRQVMRAMTGDYRKKMEEEKTKQYKLIQTEVASSGVKVVSNPPKKCVFHRRAEVKTQTAASEGNQQQSAGQEADAVSQAQETSEFVFTPSKEEFRFNFL